MSELIQPILDGFVALLKGMSFGSDPALATVGYAWTGTLINAPGAWVMPGRTQFPERGAGNGRNMIHGVTIRLGITGADPEELTPRVLRYVQAVDAAIQALLNTTWGNTIRVLYVFIVEHDYGRIWTNGGTVAFWPDIHIEVEVEELS
jgi:hypothetical protein